MLDHIFNMRKFNIKTINNQSRMATEPVTQTITRKRNFDRSISLNKRGNLELFHDQLLLRQKELMQNIRRTQSNTKTEDTRELWRKQALQNDISKATEALSQMRKQMNLKKTQVNQDKPHDKLSRFIESLQISLEKRKYQQMMKLNQPVQAPPPPIYYPVPMPFPISNSQNTKHSKYRKQQQYTRSSFNSKYRSDSFYQKITKNHELSRGARLKKNKKKFKKVVNSIIFTIYLRNFCRKMREMRKISFSKLQSSFQSSLSEITEISKKLLKPFYSLLFTKRQVSYDIQQNESKQIAKGKVESMRRFIQMILQAAKKSTELATSNKKYVELFYHLCKHGNYSCTIPILTTEQLELSCISVKFNYVSSNQHLENAAFINLFFMKMLIYNILLSPSKVSSQFQEEVLSNNLYVLSSILYELAIQVQDQEMIKVPKSYKIGNFKQVRGVRISLSLTHNNALKCEGELISGLKSEEWIRKYFNFQSWSDQIKALKQTIHIFHKSMVKYHQLISKQCI